jgi:hypothetical protein
MFAPAMFLLSGQRVAGGSRTQGSGKNAEKK